MIDEPVVIRVDDDTERVQVVRLDPADDTPTVVYVPGSIVTDGAGSLDELADVDTTGVTPGQVLVRGDDGVWYPQTPTAAPQWGDAVTFAEAAPDPDTAPESAVWVQLGDEMTIYRKVP